LRSFLSMRDCSPTIPSRGTAHDCDEQLCRETADADLSQCEFLAVRATPYNASCGLARSLRVEATASKVSFELAQTGGISSCLGNSDRTTGRIVRSDGSVHVHWRHRNAHSFCSFTCNQ
jgi:hypothetical protein